MTTADFMLCLNCPTSDACAMAGRCLERRAAKAAPPHPRAAVLREAERLITGPREADYGPPSESFARAAAFATLETGHRLTPRDVVRVLWAVKSARLRHQPGHEDSALDRIAYDALRYEVSDDFADTVAALGGAPQPQPAPAGQPGQSGAGMAVTGGAERDG